MRRFTRLYLDLDETNRTAEKIGAIERYFREAPAADAAWGLYFLTGQKIKRLVTAARLRDWAVEASGLPRWMIGECYEAVGDSAETLALLCADGGCATTTLARASDSHVSRETPDDAGLSLSVLVEHRLLPMKRMDPEEQQRIVAGMWAALDEPGRLVWNKLITGEFRVGAGKRLAVRALAEVTGVSAAEMEHRLTGRWQPTAADYLRITAPLTVGISRIGADGREEVISEGGAQAAQGLDPGRPYPFFLAHQLLAEPGSLGPVEGWQIEWKWDGIRAQVIRRDGRTLVWTRGEELVTNRYHEIASDAALLPPGTVLDGEILAWERGKPMPFMALQRRIGRIDEQPRLFPEAPVVFQAYDALEVAGKDVRGEPLSARRAMLEGIAAEAVKQGAASLRVSETLGCATWEDAGEARAGARGKGVEGLMLKRVSSPYGVGRTRGDWWKWKVDPFTIDAVLIAAQPGHGKRAGLFTDYTFGLWDAGALTPVAKAYSGLTDAEIAEVDAWVRAHTLSRHGPVRAVTPELVFELGFEGVQESGRHKSGLAVRFPRMLRRRADKAAAEADTLDTLRSMLRGAGA